MKIRDLPEPITASKSDWLAGTTWIGFTPMFADPKIAKAVAQLCHPSPRKEAECLRWIPITT